MKLPLLFAALLIVAAPASAARRRKPAAARAARKKAAAPKPAPAPARAPRPAPPPAAKAAPAAAKAAPAVPRDEATLGAFGAELFLDGDGLTAAGARPGSPAAAMGLRTDDRVWDVDRAAVKTAAEAAAARRAAAPEERESLVVRRGLEALALTDEDSTAPKDFERGPRDLSAREAALAGLREAADETRARDAVAETAPLDWSVRADQAFWIRFPGGLPAGLHADDVAEAEAATGLTTDGALDFLAIPPRTRVWARVAAAREDGEVRTLRLVFFKMQPPGAQVYPILGAATALAGVPAAELARVSAGGTLVVAAPIPEPNGKRRRGKDLLVDENARLRVRLLDPVTLAEPASWWRAGPGLWLKTAADKDGRRRFQVTHVVAGRSAAAAGLKVGELLDGVAGRSSERLDFEEALDALYGAPGTTVKVSIATPDGSKTVELTRGVKTDGKTSSRLPLPFETR